MSVADDGNGIPNGRLNAINDALTAERFSQESHGLENVYQRMKLMYPLAAIQVRRAEPKGVRLSAGSGGGSGFDFVSITADRMQLLSFADRDDNLVLS